MLDLHFVNILYVNTSVKISPEVSYKKIKVCLKD